MSGLYDNLNTIDDVQSLIDNSIRESQVLEYKTASGAFSETNKQELVKDVTAMANSGGGLIIYGVATDQSDKTKPLSINPLNIANIETFDRVINSQAKPPVFGLRKKVIPETTPQVMLVEIPSSDTPPHQNLYDKKYYRRSGTESLPMEHDLVSLMFGKKMGPMLKLNLQALKKPTTFRGEPLFTDQATLRLLVENNGRRVGKFVEVVLVFPGLEFVRIIPRSGTMIEIDNLYQGKQARQFTKDVGVFHPSSLKSILEINFEISKAYIESKKDEPFVQWTIFADEMSPQQGSSSLSDLLWSDNSIPIETPLEESGITPPLASPEPTSWPPLPPSLS